MPNITNEKKEKNTKLYNTLEENLCEMVVLENDIIVKFKRFFIYIIVIFCFVASTVIITSTKSLFSYILIPISILLLIYYKFVYLKTVSREEYVLRVSNQEIIYANPEVTYKIPLTSIQDIEDKSFYYDFPGRGNNGWNHSFNLLISKEASYYKTRNNKEELIISQDSTRLVSIYSLNLKHSDNQKVFNYIQKKLTMGK